MKLSVLMLAYNHAPFIAEAIESALCQEASFEWEIVVGEDLSTDGTREIVARYAAQHRGRIRALLPERNLGMHGNFRATLDACRGELVAILEGDDRWTSPQKIARQVAALDAHPEWALCFHPVAVERVGGGEPPREFPEPRFRREAGLAEILAHNFIATCSVMFRAGLSGPLPEAFSTLPMGDWPLHVLNAEHGRIGFLPETMALYREHPGGAWSASGAVERLARIERTYAFFAGHLREENRGLARRHHAAVNGELALRLVESGQARRARPHLAAYLAGRGFLRPGVRSALPRLVWRCLAGR